MSKYFVFITVLFYVWITPLAASEGTILVLYGTPCAGKSTLTAVLEKVLPGNFRVIKKTKLVDEMRRDIIEQVTGERLQKRADLIEKAHGLSPELKKKAMAVSAQAMKITMQKIGERADRGENIIFDVCMKDPTSLEYLEERKVIKIFVYAPLSVLTERDFQRAYTHNQGKFFHHRRRNSILSMYMFLVRPAQSEETPIDWISRQQLEEYLSKTEEDLAFPLLKETCSEAMCSFQLNEQNEIGLVPAIQPDLLIPSHKLSPEEGAERVKKYLLSLRTVDIEAIFPAISNGCLSFTTFSPSMSYGN